MAQAAQRKTGVLFVNSPVRLGADTFIHTHIRRALDQSRFDAHVACSARKPGDRTPAFEVLSTIPELHLRPSNFGPSLNGRSTIDKSVQLLCGLATGASLAS